MLKELKNRKNTVQNHGNHKYLELILATSSYRNKCLLGQNPILGLLIKALVNVFIYFYLLIFYNF